MMATTAQTIPTIIGALDEFEFEVVDDSFCAEPCPAATELPWGALATTVPPKTPTGAVKAFAPLLVAAKVAKFPVAGAVEV